MPLPADMSLAFISCPACNGTGKIKNQTCSQCGGRGVGAFQADRFLFCALPLSKTLISLRKVKKIVDHTLNIGLALAGAAGLVALGWWLYTHSLSGSLAYWRFSSWHDFAFWNARHPLLLAFWFSAATDAYLVYRLSRARDLNHVIKRAAYQKPGAALPAKTWEEIAHLSSRQLINTALGLNEEAYRVIEQAFLLAERSKHARVQPLHIFASALLLSNEVASLFSRLGIAEQKVVEGVERLLARLTVNVGRLAFSAEALETVIEAYARSAAAGRTKVSPLALLLPAVERDELLAELLFELEADMTKLSNAIAWFQVSDQLVENYKAYRRMARFKPSSTMDRAYTALATPLLDHFSTDWTLAAKWGRVELCVGREEETRRMFDALESGHTGLVLVGPLGVGKTTLIGGLASRMVLEDVPERLQDKRLIELDIARLIGGSTPAEAEEKLLSIIAETSRARNIILFIKDIEKIAGITSGGESSLNLAGVLADAISRRIIYCFASASDENYVKFIEHTPLGEALFKIEVIEPDINRAILMIESKISALEGRYGVYFSYNALAEVVSLTAKYIHDAYLPAKAIEVLEAVSVSVSRRDDRTVDREAIAAVITERTHIPVTKLTQSESQNLLNLEDRIHGRMIGQEEAVKMVASSLRRARVELRESKRPIANFLFLGPTGVGKTELAKTVAEVYFGREDYMIRLDMSEYQNEDSVNKMIGSPEGVRGYLTEAVRKMPFSLILLDEIEKAHPDILNLFLQVMDDGRLTDGQGKTIDFTNSILIATSNVGSALIQEKVRAGIDLATIKDQLLQQELVKMMRPELINRFDGVIIFRPLEQADVVSIAGLMIKKIAKMVESKGFGFEISQVAIAELARLGFQPEYGARPLRRLLQERLEDAIATKLLEGGISRRDTVVVGDDLVITVRKAQLL